MTVVDSERRDVKGNCAKYTGALIKLLRFWNSGVVNHQHGMVEVETWPRDDARSKSSRHWRSTNLLDVHDPS